MSDPTHAHGFDAGKPAVLPESDLIFDCPACLKSLAVDQRATGHTVQCPLCRAEVKVPELHRVIPLDEAPETPALKARPAWEQKLIQVEAALREATHQRQEAGNLRKHHLSEANRQQLRVEKLDARLAELDYQRKTLHAEHPQP